MAKGRLSRVSAGHGYSPMEIPAPRGRARFFGAVASSVLGFSLSLSLSLSLSTVSEAFLAT